MLPSGSARAREVQTETPENRPTAVCAKIGIRVDAPDVQKCIGDDSNGTTNASNFTIDLKRNRVTGYEAAQAKEIKIQLCGAYKKVAPKAVFIEKKLATGNEYLIIFVCSGIAEYCG